MDNQEQQIPSPKIRLWRYLPILILMGLAVHLLVPQITTLEKSWSIVTGLTWWAVALAVIAQAFSYLGSGYILHAILNANQERLSVFRGVLITMAATSIGLVAGGWVGGAAATYGWVRRESREGNVAVLAGTLPSMLNNTVLMGVALIGTLYLIVIHDLTSTQLIEFGIILLILGLAVIGVLTALRFPERVTSLMVWLAGRWAALFRKPFEPRNTITSVDGFFLAWRSLRNGKWLRPALGATANIGFDMLTLYFLFIAAGQYVSLGVLFAGYGLPFILGKMAFMFPGGVGIIEGSMVALYTSLMVLNAVSVVVILGYRLISFWLPSLLGFAAAAYLQGLQRNANQA
jgi:uncharacterized protein (TIRG00374 family)